MKILYFFTALLVFTALLPAQSEEEELVRQSYEYTKDAEFMKFAELLDPDELRQMKKVFDEVVRADAGGQFLNDFSKGMDAEEFYELSGAEFFGRLLAFTFKQAPEAALQLKNAEQQLLGSIREDNMLHVLVRNKAGGEAEYNRLEVVTVVEKEGKKYLKMKDEFKALQQRALELTEALK